MGFRINNNISALVAQSNLQKSQGGMSTSIERLSSGLRINRGADDAAGLTISEKLRGQIRGLNRAVTNAQDGISLIQTAEGALNEDAAILNRMRELAIQAQEDALTANDRLEIQKEVDQLVDEVDRISKTTEFNTKKLLDGTANALVSSDSSGLEVYQMGAASKAAGDYNVKVSMEEPGVKQVQMSSILTNKESGTKAGLSTQMKDIASFYDNDGNNVLDKPSTMTLRGNGQKVDITLSSDMTLQELADKVETSVTASIEDGGLGIKNSTFAFNAQKGQFVFESGKDGANGEVAFAAEEDVLKAFGFQITTESEAAAYKISATTIGKESVTTTSANTTTDRASGVIEGLDIKFELATEARMDGKVAAQEVITLTGTPGTDDIQFSIGDTNRQNDGSLFTQTARIDITITAGRSYTLASIEGIINNTVSSTANGPAISASFNGYDLVLTSSESGTSGIVSIGGANNAATDILGIRNGTTAGMSGTSAILAGTVDVSSGVDIDANGLTVSIIDGDGSFAGAIGFAPNSQVSGISLVDTFNNAMSTANVKAQAIMNSEGKLEIQSTETGGDTRLTISKQNTNMNLAVLGFIDQQSVVGSGGSAAVFTGNTHDSAKKVGYLFDETVNFTITDKNGASSGTISISSNAGGTNDFAISQASISSVLDATNLNSTDVGYSFDAGGRLDFYSKSAGGDARIITTAGTSSQITFARNALGLDINSATQGSGKTDYVVHVADTSLTFQIGANQNQHLNFEIVNTSAESLGLTGLDITNIKSATRALGAIDSAVQIVSSERSKLGSLQNRLGNTINNLTVTSNNLQATESKIRDVDVATETVEFTRNQILIQAGTSQLAQAKGLPQNALQLLQG
jgi:flagellin